VESPTRNIAREIILNNKVTKDPDARERVLIKRLADLIEKCVVVDPLKRITPEEAARHSVFIEPTAEEVASEEKKLY